MTHAVRKVAAIALALLVVAGTAVYAVTRTTSYESDATLVLAPAPENPETIPFLLDSFTRSGTQGTYVELLDSNDLARRAQATGVEFSVRGIPDTRVIGVTATGERGEVTTALERLIATVQREQGALRDPWEVQVLEAPSAPAAAGPNTRTVMLTGVVLSVLVALLAWVLLPRRRPESQSQPPLREPQAVAGAASPTLVRERRGS